MIADHLSIEKQSLVKEEQIIRAAQKDTAAFKPLYERYYKPVFLFIFHKVTDQATAADITSQVFLKALLHLPKYKLQGVPFSAWLYRIAHNEVMQYFRKNHKIRKVMVDETFLSEIYEEEEPPHWEPLKERLVSIISQLPLAEIHLIELRFYERKPFKEIAYILQITENHAKVKTYRLLDKIKRLLIDQKINS